MELADLRIFLAVADAGGITRAAQELHTVQSNVSARLAALERDLGAQLFRRHSRGVSLTNPGEQLLPYARRISELAEEARRSIGDDAVPSGPLRIGSLETTAGLRLPAVLSSFTAECPGVDFSLVTGPTESLVGDVLAYRLDGALVTGPVRHPELIETTMFVEELVLLTARWIVDLDTALLATGCPHVLVFRAGCSYRARLEHVLRERGVAEVKLLEYGTLEGILGCVGAGLGVSLLPRAVVERHLADGRVCAHELKEQESKAKTIFVQRRNIKSPPALTRFVEHLNDAARPPVLQMVGGGPGPLA